MFKKAVIFSDLHLGKKANSETHNLDCQDYIDWMINEAKSFKAETAIFCGDFHDVRSTLNIRTFNHSIEILKKLSKAFEETYILLGNHDLYLRNSLEINSLKAGNLIPNINIIDKLLFINSLKV